MCYDQKEYNEDVINAIKGMVDGRGTEGSICFFLSNKYKQYAQMFFNDAIRKLEYNGRIVRMENKGVVWWELTNA